MKSISSLLPPPLISGSRGTSRMRDIGRPWLGSPLVGDPACALALSISFDTLVERTRGVGFCSEEGRVERIKSAKSLVSSVITLGSRGRNPDLRVLVFIGSGRGEGEEGAKVRRYWETRGTTPVFLGEVARGGGGLLAKSVTGERTADDEEETIRGE